MNDALKKLADIARNPYDHVQAWKAEHNVYAIGTMPMHFPAELIHAAGALPVVLQELPDPITTGGGAMYPFFCGFTRSIVDQSTKNQLDFLDAIVFSDHCVQLLSAADVMRISRPEQVLRFRQVIASVRQPWSEESSTKTWRDVIEDLEEILRVNISEDDVRRSISIFNENRQLIREIYELRRRGEIQIKASELQHIVKSSMVMDKETHTALLKEVISSLKAVGGGNQGLVPVYLSGHMCHAPRVEILEMIEDCGATVVDDDMYHGFRYVSTDVREDINDPLTALSDAYINKNTNAPCPTRIDPDVDWNEWLLKAVTRSNAEGLIVLLVKFCEPHYFAYPHIKTTFDDNDIPHLLVETEHEGVAMENLRTKVETFVEMIREQNRVEAV